MGVLLDSYRRPLSLRRRKTEVCLLHDVSLDGEDIVSLILLPTPSTMAPQEYGLERLRKVGKAPQTTSICYEGYHLRALGHHGTRLHELQSTQLLVTRSIFANHTVDKDGCSTSTPQNHRDDPQASAPHLHDVIGILTAIATTQNCHLLNICHHPTSIR